MKTVLFLCTGNYYRSRFAELYFRHLAIGRGLDWEADSRGLALDVCNTGPMSHHTLMECQRLGIAIEPLRLPRSLEETDLERADMTIAVKETEHRPLMRWRFPHWEERIEYWEIHDLDRAEPHEAFPKLRTHVEGLISRLADSL